MIAKRNRGCEPYEFNRRNIALQCKILILFYLSFAKYATAEKIADAFAASVQWVHQKSNFAEINFRAVHAVSADVAWIGGSNGTCLRTIDGGQKWEVLNIPDAHNLDFRAVVAFDDTTAVLMSAGDARDGKARIYRTDDGGKNWTLAFQTKENGVFLDGIAFWDKDNGVVLGDPIDGKWYLLKTNDGGKSWRRIPPVGLPEMLPDESAFAASNSSLVVHGQKNAWIGSGGAKNARIFRSTDQGNTWHAVQTPMISGPNAGIFGLYFFNAQKGIGVGGDHKKEQDHSDNIIFTHDGGKSWQKTISYNPPGLKEAVAEIKNNAFLVVGPAGTSVCNKEDYSSKKVDAIPLHAVSCAQGCCWGVGAKGALVKLKEINCLK